MESTASSSDFNQKLNQNEVLTQLDLVWVQPKPSQPIMTTEAFGVKAPHVLTHVPRTISRIRRASSGLSGLVTVYTPSSSSPTASTIRWLRWRLSLVRLWITRPPRIKTTSADRGADRFWKVTSDLSVGSMMWRSSPWNKVMESSSTGRRRGEVRAWGGEVRSAG